MAKKDGFILPNYKLNYKRGDIMEVKISDSSYKTYYKKKVDVGNDKDLRILFDDLVDMGIDFFKLAEVKVKDRWW